MSGDMKGRMEVMRRKAPCLHVSQHCSSTGLLPPLPERRIPGELAMHREGPEQTVRGKVPKIWDLKGNKSGGVEGIRNKGCDKRL